jgi:sugar O-acyltransferase (sialic acid O-acetyltransferase NeuD family)
MSPKRIIMMGGLGNASVIAAAIQDARRRGRDEWDVAGYVNDRLQVGDEIEGLPVLGGLDSVPRLLDQGYYFINTIYRIDGQDLRIALFEKQGIPDERLATFVHPMAYVAGNVTLGPGTVVMPHAAVTAGTRIGRCCLVMIGAFIGHNNDVGDYGHFAAHCCVGSYLKIGRGVHIGLNASVRENLTLGDCSSLAMGGVLVNNMKEYEIWVGVPAKLLRMARKELT